MSKLCDKRWRLNAAISLLALSLTACATERGRVQAPLAAEGDGEPDAGGRRPDGVVLEPPTALPAPLTRAPADGVIALRQPVSADAVADLVETIADAWQRGSLDALVAVLSSDAGPLEARSRGRTALVDSWRQRLRARDYTRVANVELVRREKIGCWQSDELGRPDAPAAPPGMRAGEILVRVPFEVTRVAGDRLFGDVLVLVARLEDGKLKVVAYGETDAL